MPGNLEKHVKGICHKNKKGKTIYGIDGVRKPDD